MRLKKWNNPLIPHAYVSNCGHYTHGRLAKRSPVNKKGQFTHGNHPKGLPVSNQKPLTHKIYTNSK